MVGDLLRKKKKKKKEDAVTDKEKKYFGRGLVRAVLARCALPTAAELEVFADMARQGDGRMGH